MIKHFTPYPWLRQVLPSKGGRDYSASLHQAKRVKLLIVFLLLLPLLTLAQENIVNVYNWGDFMPPGVLKQFEKETGIHVNYSEFDSNDTLYAKLKATRNSGYDVIVPSNYFINRY